MLKYQYYCPNCHYHREGLLDHPAIGIGSYSTLCPECNSHYASYVPSLEFWTIENTGWSGGTSWFKTGGTDSNPLRFNSEEEALSYGLACKADPDTKWRLVHTTITREENKDTTTREWKQI